MALHITHTVLALSRATDSGEPCHCATSQSWFFLRPFQHFRLKVIHWSRRRFFTLPGRLPRHPSHKDPNATSFLLFSFALSVTLRSGRLASSRADATHPPFPSFGRYHGESARRVKWTRWENTVHCVCMYVMLSGAGCRGVERSLKGPLLPPRYGQARIGSP